MNRFSLFLIVIGVLLIACGVKRDLTDRDWAAIAKAAKQQENNP